MSRHLFPRVVRRIDNEYFAALSIGSGAVAALLWSGFGSRSYRYFVDTEWHLSVLRSAALDSVHQVTINALMAIFFFAIGLELSREIRSGMLRRPSHAVPPVLAALGGMLATALLSLLIGFLANSHALRRGWGIPMATDIAFTLGILALAGRRLPAPVRLFLLTLAVADDAFSVIVLTFTGATHVYAAGVIAIFVSVAFGAFVLRHTRGMFWMFSVALAVWLCFLWAHVEPALAGVVAGLLVTSKQKHRVTIEVWMTRISSAVALPIFALIACGVRWREVGTNSVALTIIFATIGIRIVGKVLGISGGVSVAKQLGFRLHTSITWPLLLSASVLCAIGFTVPLLYAGAIFGSTSKTYGAFTLGLLGASLVAGFLGVTFLRRAIRSR
jgi:NhaA family Na+:H+ antiporter